MKKKSAKKEHPLARFDELVALSNQGWEAIVSGEYQKACDIYEEVLADPENHGRASNNACIAYLLEGDARRASDVMYQARQRRERHYREVSKYYGVALWHLGRYTEACEDWVSENERSHGGEAVSPACKTPPYGASQIQLVALIWWASLRLNNGSLSDYARRDMKKMCPQVESLREGGWRDGIWPGALADLVLGTLSADELVDRALSIAGNYEHVRARNGCTACFYVSCLVLQIGDAAGYRRCLQQSVDALTDRSMMPTEFLMARYELSL